MLLPRYSLRTTLTCISACAVLFLIAGEAVQGRGWAIVISITALSFASVFFVHAGFYFMVSVLGNIIGAPLSPARTSHGGIQTSSDQQFPPADEESVESST